VPPRPTGRSSARSRPTPTSAEEFALTGPSVHPDPDHHAYRKDLADVALAGLVIASHYAAPLGKKVAVAAALQAQPSDESDVVRELVPGEPFLMLDDSVGWAWGYAGKDRRVGYVRSDALTAA